MATTAQQLYSEAASVRGQTGVDPAIIATIAQTESSLSLAPPFTLGITTAATRGGSGTSGGSLRSPNTYGGTQPAAFWSYQNGAEASRAFGDYIRAYQPSLAPLLSNARQFFNPSGPIATSNYYVPTNVEAAQHGSAIKATFDYYAHWLQIASAFPSDVSGSTPAGSDPLSQVGAILFPTPISTDGTGDGGPHNYFQPIPGFGPWPGVKVSFGFLWGVLFFAGGLAAIVFGLMIYFHKEIEATAGRVVRLAAAA